MFRLGFLLLLCLVTSAVVGKNEDCPIKTDSDLHVYCDIHDQHFKLASITQKLRDSPHAIQLAKEIFEEAKAGIGKSAEVGERLWKLPNVTEEFPSEEMQFAQKTFDEWTELARQIDAQIVETISIALQNITDAGQGDRLFNDYMAEFSSTDSEPFDTDIKSMIDPNEMGNNLTFFALARSQARCNDSDLGLEALVGIFTYPLEAKCNESLADEIGLNNRMLELLSFLAPRVEIAVSEKERSTKLAFARSGVMYKLRALNSSDQENLLSEIKNEFARAGMHFQTTSEALEAVLKKLDGNIPHSGLCFPETVLRANNYDPEAKNKLAIAFLTEAALLLDFNFFCAGVIYPGDAKAAQDFADKIISALNETVTFLSSRYLNV